MRNTAVQVTITKTQANALFSIYTDIAGFVESNKEYQDVSKAESDANAIKNILDQLDSNDMEYERGY